jgi:hypothetical protein
MWARWTALVRCFDDGRLALDNNPAERALRSPEAHQATCDARQRGSSSIADAKGRKRRISLALAGSRDTG